MDWDKWAIIEKILIREKIEPILAVVPDNKDKDLMVGEVHSGFWNAVRSWQGRGWVIGVHGYQHTYVTDRAGLIGIKNRSEFAGLDETEQESKLNNALALFQRQAVTPEVWVAPGHSFDAITLRVLKRMGLDVVSDGLYLSPNIDSHGIKHIPQQLWRFWPMPFGLWTVCYHHNDWTRRDFDRFESDVERYRNHITTLRQVLQTHRIRNRRVSDRLFSSAWLLALQSRSTLRKFIAHGYQTTEMGAKTQP
jgi:hypothetical protein